MLEGGRAVGLIVIITEFMDFDSKVFAFGMYTVHCTLYTVQCKNLLAPDSFPAITGKESKYVQIYKSPFIRNRFNKIGGHSFSP